MLFILDIKKNRHRLPRRGSTKFLSEPAGRCINNYNTDDFFYILYHSSEKFQMPSRCQELPFVQGNRLCESCIPFAKLFIRKN